MDINQIITDAHCMGISLFVEDGKLGYKSKNKILNKNILSSISSHKAEIIKFLTSEKLRTNNPLAKKYTSLSQQRIWLIEKLSDNTNEFNIPINIELKGDWSVSGLEKSLTEIVNQHDILRSVYHEEDNILWQQVASNAKLSLEVIDLTHLNAVEVKKSLNLQLNKASAHSFDLSKEIPIKASVFLITDNRKILNLTVHHIALDDSSCQKLLKLLLENDQPLNIEQPQYCEYAEWQRLHINSESFKQKAKRYAHELKGLPPLHPLPLIAPHNEKTSSNAKSITCMVPDSIADKARILQQKYNLTSFGFYQTCIAKYISSWTNSNDIVMGAPVIHRPTERMSSIFGCFLNLQVIHHKFNFEESFDKLLSNASETHKKLLSYQDIPFEHLLNELNPHRTPYFTPVFQILISMHHQDEATEIEESDSSWEYYGSETKTIKYDITIKIITNGRNTTLLWQYKKDLFSEKMIEQLSTSFNKFLSSIIDNPQTPINKVNLGHSSTAELINYSTEKKKYQSPNSLLAMIEKHSLNTPDATAIEYGLSQLTYQEVMNGIHHLSLVLKNKGVNKGDRVAVIMQRSPQMLLAMLAIMSVGGAYVPLDPEYPAERLDYIIEHSKCKLCLLDIENNGVTYLKENLVIGNDFYQQASKSTNTNSYQQFNFSSSIDSDDSAYIIFTSGSTGLPKGVEVSHGNLTNFISSILVKPGISKQDKLLAITPISFDISILELFAPLAAGACVVIAEQYKRDGLSLKTRLEQFDITIMQATPASWQSIIDAGWLGCSSVKSLCGGEALTIELANELQPKVSSLWNMYGPTEATVWSTCLKVGANNQRAIALGEPINDTGIYIVDEHNQPCPFEKQGEIIITGSGIAKGYFNRPELTAERFFLFDTPLGKVKAYRTGDLGYITSDGQLFCNGRNDHQIKLRGFRIELGEIEAQLLAIHGINQACVVVKELSNKGKKLIAYVVLAKVHSLFSTEGITQEVKRLLPSYMVPDNIELLEKLPLTPSGKVDRNTLRALPISHIEEKYTAPKTEIEKLLANIWRKCLKIEKVGVTDNFFALGGDSILAVRAVAETVDSGYKMTNSQLFTHQTIRELASQLTNKVDAIANENESPTEQTINGIKVFGTGISEDDLNSLICEFE